MALFATYCEINSSCVQRNLLAFSTFESKISQDADSHIEFIEFVLDVYGKNLTSVVAVIAENCAVNRSISTKLQINLFVKSLIIVHESTIINIRELMKS